MKKNKTDLTKDIIEQFQLPSYVAKKTFAEASKAIDNKFKDRKDMHSQETKEELLERLAEAQEYIKMQHEAEAMANMPPEMQQQMMAQQQSQVPQQGGGIPDLNQMLGQRMDTGGYTNGRQPVQTVNGLTAQEATMLSEGPSADTSGLVEQTGSTLGASVGGNAGAAIGGATQLVGLGIDAFKDSGIDTSGKMGRMDNVNVGAETGKAALKGAAAGAALGSVIPGVGTVIGGAAGAVIGGASGFIKGKKGRADSIAANTNALYSENNEYDNNFNTGRVAAMGGYVNGERRKMATGGQADPLFWNRLGETLQTATNGVNMNNIGQSGNWIDYNNPSNIRNVNMNMSDMSNINFTPPQESGFSKAAKKTGSWVKDNYGEMMSLAPAIGGVFDKIEKPTTEVGTRLSNVYEKERMDEQSMRNAINQANIQGALSESSGGDIGALRNNLLAAHAGKMGALSQAYQGKKAFDAQQNQMAHEYKANANQFNAQMDDRYIDRKARDEGAYNTAKQLKRQAILENIGSVGRELSDKSNVARMFGYKWNGKYWVNNKGEQIDTATLTSIIGSGNKDKSAE